MTLLARRLLAAALALGLAPLLPPALSNPGARADTPPDSLVIATQIDDLVSLDPAEIFEFSGADAANNIYDTLVAFDPRDLGPLVGGIAESWSLDPDGRTYRFKLREGLRFHSGNPVTAEDAVFSLRRAILLQQTPSFILAQFGFTAENLDETITSDGPLTVTLRVDKPYAPSFFLTCLTATIGAVVDKRTVLANEQDGDLGHNWLKTHSAGSGAYRLRVWKPNELYALEANPDYWRQKPAMRRVFVRHIAESTTQRLLLEKGDTDIARNLSPEDIEALAGRPGLKVEEDLKGPLLYLAMNQKHPILGKPPVVEAIKHLIDYDGLARTLLRGQFVPHQAFLPKTYLGALDEQPYALDVAKARALLVEAGLAEGFAITLSVRNVPERLQIAQSLQSTFGQAGIEVALRSGTAKQVLTSYRARKHELLLGTWGPDYPDPHTNADTFAHNPDNSDAAGLTGKLMWRNAWDDPELTTMTEAALLERDTETRAALYREIQRRLQRQGPFAIMFQQNIQSAMRDSVEGFVTGGAVANSFYWTVTK